MSNTPVIETLVTSLVTSLPLAGELSVRAVDTVPSLESTYSSYQLSGWTGSLSIVQIQGSSIPDMFGNDLTTALKPAVEAGFAAVGLADSATVETVNGFPSQENAQGFIVSVDESDVLFIAVEEGASFNRQELNTSPQVGSHFVNNIRRIRDVNMDISVVIGRTVMTISDLMRLEPGQVVELDRAAGAPADILVNGKEFAYGEVVVQDLDYGVKITAIKDDTDENEGNA